MPLAAGTKFGPYEIVGPLGAGGMGEVYQARDTRLERSVAIKILPPHAAADPEFRARFDREAKSISQLNHPNICVLFDIGEANGASYLVMEHLQGETLAKRLEKGPLPTEELLTVATEIADALDKAHRHGIIHRDLKPANVMLTPTGSKLLDFGLAKPGVVSTGTIETRLATSIDAQGQTRSTPLTARGSILGTFQYMAPEQIEGGESDARTDIWAFGCVLYEMVTGKRAFEGKSQASLIASILERQPPPMAELQPMTPPALGRIVRTCLAKNPDDRFQTAHDLGLHLKWIEEGGSAAGLPAPVIAHRKRRERAIFGGIAGLVAIASAAAAWYAKPAPAATNVVARFTDLLPEDQSFSRTGRRVVALSDDGTQLVYVANNQLYSRKLNDQKAQPIPGTGGSPSEPVFSPNGEWIAFWTNGGSSSTTDESGKLWRIPASGGTPTPLCDTGNPSGMSWTGNRIVWGTRTEIRSLPDTGGTPETLVRADVGKNEQVGHPQLLDDGKYLIYTLTTKNWNEGQIVGQPLPSGERRVLVAGGTAGRLVRSGHLVYHRDATLFAVAFDAASHKVRGGPVPMVQHVRSGLSGNAQAAISGSGTLAFLEGASGGNYELAWVDRTGRADKIAAAPARNYFEPRLSPDGTRIVTSTRDESPDLYIWDLRRSTESRVTVGEAVDQYPVWSRDGRDLFFATESDGQFDIFRRRADLTTGAEPVTKTKDSEQPLSVSADGSTLLAYQFRIAPDRLVIRATGKDAMAATNTPLIGAAYGQRNGTLSPNGRWVAYEGREGDNWEVFVRPFPDAGSGRYQISQGGAQWPAWSPSGNELFFVMSARTGAPAKLMVATVKTPGPGPAFDWTEPKMLFDMTPYIRSSARGYDVAADGRFVMVQVPAGTLSAEGASIHFVTHWFDELKARVK